MVWSALAVLCLWPVASADGQIKEKVPTFAFKVRLTLKSQAALSAKDVKYAALPGGKHVGLSYTGVTDPETIAHYGKLGFRTSVAVTPATSAEAIRALEDAGADLVVGYGMTGSEMGLTPQEAFDGSTMWRVNLLKKARGPAAIGGYYSMRMRYELPVDRRMGRYLYTIHDSNFLACNSWATGYSILVGRNRTPEQMVRPHNANSVRTAPNTLVYYQTVGNILQGIVEMMNPGEVTTIALRRFKDADAKKVERFIGKYGKDPRIWHTTQHEICGYAYLKEKSRVVDVKAAGDKAVDVVLSIEQDTYLPFCRAPMSLQLPKDFPLDAARLGATDCPVTVTDKGVFVDIPVRQAFADGCTMTLKMPESMTIPEDMPVALTIKNTSGEALESVRLRWSASVGMEVVVGPSEAFALAPKAERTIQATVRTRRGERRGIRPAGARFGLAPISAYVTAATAGKAERTFLASWEVLVAPRLRVEMDPRHVPIPQGQAFPVFVHLANGRVDHDRAWGSLHHEKLIDHRAGACKGTVGFALPAGVEAEPASQAFDLPADGHATFRFLIKNNQWGDEKPVYLRPAVRFAGETDPIEAPWYGTAVMRDQATECKPADAQGLLARAAWDDRANTRANLDQAAGSKVQSCPGAAGGGSTPSHEGVKAWCLGWNSNVAFDAFRNIDYRQGTVLFWTRRDPRVRNDIGTAADPKTSWQVPGEHKNYGEKLFCVGLNRDLILRRYPKHRDQEGYLELALAEMPVRGRKTKVHYLQVPFDTDKLYDWRHVAIVWDVSQRRLELYLDGQLAGRADKGADDWLILPWDRGGTTHDMIIVETHHGHWSGSLRDEFYVYNRPLTPKEIGENMARAKGKAKE